MPQSGKLSKELLWTQLNDTDYYETTTTPGLWHHKWRPVMFCLIFDNFGIKYVGENHLNQLRQVLKNNYEITEDLDGTKFSGIDLKWIYPARYAECRCRLLTKGYIEAILIKFGHINPNKPQLTPNKYSKITYGAK